ncbi:MAG: DNA repair protein RadC [Acetatifactor sp.]|nr:DNA repair protein RadC [Acetatifactor sp.]
MNKKQQKEMQNQELPYEKFLRFGPESLTEGELLAIVLRTGTQDKSALELAKEVLSLGKYPKTGLLGLHDVTLGELKKIKGIGEVKAVKLKSLTELAMRFSRAKAEQGMNLRDPESIARYFMEKLRHRKTENLYLLCVDSKCQVISEKKISEGSVNRTLISPREIFIEALRVEAVNMFLVHNHPSGDPTPSAMDEEVTKTVARLGVEMCIPLLDHVIIGDNNYYSFRQAGIIA